MFWLRMGFSILGFFISLIPVALLLRISGILLLESGTLTVWHILTSLAAIALAGGILTFAAHRVGSIGE